MSVSNPTWTLTPSEVFTLPLDDLALRVLKDVRDSGEWNEHNWMQAARNEPQWNRQHDALGAFAEAWGWLRSRGLIVRHPQQSSPDAVHVSRRGHEVLEKGLPWLRATERLDIDLVAELEVKARPHVLRGDFETAAFAAMKEVEVQVRTDAGLPSSLIGTKLMQEAFKPGGPLHDPNMEGGESVAFMNLMSGAIGLFKNPVSHRQVDYTDATEAIEVILLADLLLRLLTKRRAGATVNTALPLQQT